MVMQSSEGTVVVVVPSAVVVVVVPSAVVVVVVAWQVVWHPKHVVLVASWAGALIKGQSPLSPVLG
jgi:hypothetical protein